MTYRCSSDFLKLVVCAALPRGPAEDILTITERDLQQSTREKKNLMLQELVNNDKAIYLRLVHEVFEKFEHDANQLFDRWNAATNVTPLDISAHYIQTIAFDIKMYHADQWLDEDDKFTYYKRMILGCKSKKDYIEYLKMMLQAP